MSALKMFDYIGAAEQCGEQVTEMTAIELSILCDTIFQKNPKIAAWIARDLEVRAMDKAICEAGIEE
jgi:hypothetical protein